MATRGQDPQVEQRVAPGYLVQAGPQDWVLVGLEGGRGEECDQSFRHLHGALPGRVREAPHAGSPPAGPLVQVRDGRHGFTSEETFPANIRTSGSPDRAATYDVPATSSRQNAASTAATQARLRPRRMSSWVTMLGMLTRTGTRVKARRSSAEWKEESRRSAAR